MRRNIVVNCEKMMIFSVFLVRSSMSSTSSMILRIFAESLSEVSISVATIAWQELQWVSLGFERLGEILVMISRAGDSTYLIKQSWHLDAAPRFRLSRALAKSFPSSSSSWFKFSG